MCVALPEVIEERAWVGTRWRIRTKTFAHVVPINDGWPPSYARAAASDGPITVLTVRVPPEEHAAIRATGAPFFVPPWFVDMVGVVLDAVVDWDEIAEMITESYRMLAPKKLRESTFP